MPRVQDSLVGRDVTGFEMGLPVEVCTTVTPFLDGLGGVEQRRELDGEREEIPPSARGSTCRDRWT